MTPQNDKHQDAVSRERSQPDAEHHNATHHNSSADSANAPATDSTATVNFAAADTSDIDDMSFEQARNELVSVVSQLETGGAALEESLALWQRGEALAHRAEHWLQGAQHRLHEVKADLDSQQNADAT